MRFNAKELARSSSEWQVDMEGILLIKEKKSDKQFKPTSLTEHWCRLRGNLLIICRTIHRSCQEMHSLVFLEGHIVNEDTPVKEYPSGFTLSFAKTDDITLLLVSRSQQEKANWIKALKKAGLQSIRERIAKHRQEIDKYQSNSCDLDTSTAALTTTTDAADVDASSSPGGRVVMRQKSISSQPMPAVLGLFNECNSNQNRGARLFSIGEEKLGAFSMDFEEEQGGLELTIGCRNLPCVTSEILPNSCVIVYIFTPPSNSLPVKRTASTTSSTDQQDCDSDTFQVGRTEIYERSVNPNYSKTIFIPSNQYCHTSIVKLCVLDVKEVKSCVSQCVGVAEIDVQTLENNSTYKMKLKSFGEEQRLGSISLQVAHRLPHIPNTKSSLYDLATMQFRSVCFNVLNKNFSFPQTHTNQSMKVVEYMGESVFGYEIPLQYLKHIIQSEHLLHDSLIHSSTNSANMEMCRSDLIIAMKNQIAFYENSLKLLSETGGSSFKSSRDKANPQFEFLPTNLHLNRLAVMDFKNSIVSHNDIVSVGVFAAFCRGLSHGGLHRLSTSHAESCEPDHPADLAMSLLRRGCQLVQDMRCELTNINHQLGPLVSNIQSTSASSSTSINCCSQNHFGLERFLDLVQKLQILTKDPLVSSRADFTSMEDALNKLKEFLQNIVLFNKNSSSPYKNSSSHPLDSEIKTRQNTFDRLIQRLHQCTEQLWQEKMARDILWPRILQTITHCTQPLVASKTLTQANNSGNMNSLNSSSSSSPYLSADLFALFHTRTNVCISQAITTVLSGLANHFSIWNEEIWLQMSLCGVPLSFETVLSVYLNEAAMLEDMFWTIRYLTCVRIVIKPAPFTDPNKQTATVLSRRKFEITCPFVVWSKAPESIRSRGQVTVRLHPYLFNVGINEIQTLAEKLGSTELQRTINLWSLDMLKQYFDRYIKHFEAPKKTSDKMDVCDSLDTLRDAVNGKQNKPVQILSIMERISYSLNAIRFTTCKSAKDRTSMAITLEWIRWLKDTMGLQPDHFDDALKCLRSTGLRLENVYKNVGVRKYAFGTVQLFSFPKHYKPPAGSYGGGAPS